jgi:streptogramin lyase
MNTSFVRTIRWTPKQRHASILSLLICASLPVVSSAQNLIGAQALADPTPPQISEYVREVCQDRDGDFWVGSNGDGVCRFDGKSLTYLSVKDGFGGVAVRGILQDEDGTMWFATNGGVSRYESGVFTNYTAAHGLSADSVWSMMLDSAGTIWVGTHEGVCRFDGESFGPFPLPKVAVENPESRFSPKVVFAMFEDQTGDLWFGTDMKLGEHGRWIDLAAEDRKYNADHCVVGYLVARHWRLPAFICDAIRYHHQIGEPGLDHARTMAAILQLAIDIYYRVQGTENPEWAALQPEVLGELGLAVDGLPEFVDIVLEGFHAEGSAGH